VIARDAAGNISEASTPLNAIIKDLTPPSTPTNVTCNAKTETTATLLWTPSTDNIGVSGYSIYRDGTEVGSAADTTYIDKGLTAGKTYAYTVKAVDNAGNVSGASASISVTEADITSPSTPTGLTCSSKTDTTVTLGWAASTDNVGVTEYDIYRDGTEVGSTPNTAYTDMWLISGQTYSYTVKAKDAVGNVSKESNSVSVIADSTPPSAPTNLKCTSNTNNTNIVTLTWTASTDNVTVVSYDIYRNGNKVGNTASLTYTDTGLSVNAYTYTVMAKDSAGNISLPSSQLKVTLTDTTPPTMSWVTPANKEVYKNSVLTLTASGVSDPAGVSSVVFTVYNQADGSSKNVTYSGINIGNGTWIATFDSTKHTTKTGTFIVTVTGKDNRLNSGNMGNSQFTVTGFQQGGSSITQPYDPGASIGQVNIGSSNGAITITANNVKASSSVSNVKINVHGINGQTGQVIYNQTLSMTNQGNYNWTSNFSISSVMGSYKGSIGIDLIVYGTDGSQNDYGEYNITI
jgi:GBS Bsp-like repeat./Fibronectin type III domain.